MLYNCCVPSKEEQRQWLDRHGAKAMLGLLAATLALEALRMLVWPRVAPIELLFFFGAWASLLGWSEHLKRTDNAEDTALLDRH